MTAYQQLKRELGEVRLAARIAAGFGLAENAAALSQRALQLEDELGRLSLTEVEALANVQRPTSNIELRKGVLA
jgi:hypothetical protein